MAINTNSLLGSWRDGIKMSVRTLKRKLNLMNLQRKQNIDFEDENHIRHIIRTEMSGPGSLAGYRSIWHALRLKHHLHVPRSFVANVMKKMDPDGVQARKKRKLRRRTFNFLPPFYLDKQGLPYHGSRIHFG